MILLKDVYKRQIPYWVIKDYVPDLFIVSCLSVVLLAIGGILKLKNRRNS